MTTLFETYLLPPGDIDEPLICVACGDLAWKDDRPLCGWCRCSTDEERLASLAALVAHEAHQAHEASLAPAAPCCEGPCAHEAEAAAWLQLVPPGGGLRFNAASVAAAVRQLRALRGAA